VIITNHTIITFMSQAYHTLWYHDFYGKITWFLCVTQFLYLFMWHHDVNL